MEAIASASSVIAVIETAAAVAKLCLQYSSEVKNAKYDIDLVLREVKNLKAILESVQQLFDGPAGVESGVFQKLIHPLEDGHSRLKSLEQKLCPKPATKVMSRVGLRALKWPFQRKEVDKIIQDLGRCTMQLTLGLQAVQTATVYDIDRKAVFDRLPIAEGASFDSYAEEHNATCLKDTRVDLLHEISIWADNPGAESIFWLHGMAGTGKSTISRTLAQSFSERKQLGASFFFKRGESDRSSLAKFCTTIAWQLVSNIPSLAPYVKNAIDADPSIPRKAVREQFEKLILDPLSKIPRGTPSVSTVVIVVDALDECEQDTEIKLIISLFSRAKTLNSFNLRFLVTSRPELPIRLGFHAIRSEYQDLTLHKVPETIISHDISAFIHYEIAGIKSRYNDSVPTDRQLPKDWPSESNIETLIKMAFPLFIFAATVCRFLNDRRCGTPDEQLTEVLKYQGGQELQIDATYLPVLNRLILGLSTKQRDKILHEFRDTVGPIVILASPLSTVALEKILGISIRSIDRILDSLHSVLDIPSSPTAPVRLLHLSFSDFLLDPEKQGQNPFWIDKTKQHMDMLANCLRVMENSLQKDGCHVREPGTFRSTINPESINKYLPPEVQYACRYWVYHLKESKIATEDGGPVDRFLRRHLLHWLEALSLLGRIYEAIRIINDVASSLNVANSSEVSVFLHDAKRVILNHSAIIDVSPLQIYYSAILFAPRSSLIWKEFHNEISGYVDMPQGADQTWSTCLQTLEGHTAHVTSITFSPDSSLLASGSEDGTVSIWDTITGNCLQTLNGHTDEVTSVAFSRQSNLLVSASADMTIRIWDLATGGNCLHTLTGHTDWVNSATFSPDFNLLASWSDDDTIQIWDPVTGNCLHVLNGHGSISSIAFSPDSNLLASASAHNSVEIWDPVVGNCLHTLNDHTSSVTSIAFSPDSNLLASGSADTTIKIWDPIGNCLKTLDGHTAGVNTVAFSPNSNIIVSGSEDGTVKIWNPKTGHCIHTLKGDAYSNVLWVTFSPYSNLLISMSENRKGIKIWDPVVGSCLQTINGVYSIAVSPNSNLLLTESYDQTVKVWDPVRVYRLQTLESHAYPVLSISFSQYSSLLASRSLDDTVNIWDATTGNCLHTLKGNIPLATYTAFSPDSNLLASVLLYNTVKVRDPITGNGVQILKGHTSSIGCITFSPDSSLVATGSDDNTVKIWDLVTGNCIQTLDGHASGVTLVTFSPDSNFLASVSRNKDIRVWDLVAGNCLLMLTHAHASRISSTAFSPYSTLLASGSIDGTINIWNQVTGSCLQTLNIGREISEISFHSTGCYLYTDAGIIDLAIPLDPPLIQGQLTIQKLQWKGYGINKDRTWITWNGKDLLWLPSEYRPVYKSFSIAGSTVTLGCESGQVVIINFVKDCWI